MAELVDALVSGASVERRAGSSPVLGTTWIRWESDLKNKQSECFSINNAQVVKLVYTLL